MRDHFRPEIEGLRTLAIVPILLFHLDPKLCPGGFLGVDVFFVISGYLISRMICLQGASFRFREFYVRRFFRLFPALLVTILATLIVAYRFAGPTEYVRIAWSALAAATATSNIYFTFAIDYFNPAGHALPLLHTWSLSLEEQVYLVWPVLILAAVRLRLLAPALLSVSVLSFALVLFYAPINSQLVFYGMPFRIFEFGAGAFLAVTEPRIRLQDALRAWLGWLGLALILYPAAFVDMQTPWPGFWTLAPVAATCLLILSSRETGVGLLLRTEPMRFVGRISYSLYLVHWPMIALYRSYAISTGGAVELVLLGAASFLSAYALYSLVEQPFRTVSVGAPSPSTRVCWSAFEATLRRLRRPAISAGAAALVLGCAAVIASGGLPSRVERTRVQFLDKGLTFAGDVCDQRHARCTFGDPDSPRVVYVVGDSHALNLIYGLDQLFRAHKIRGVALYDHGCFFAYGTTRFINGVRDEKCRRNVERSFQLLAANRDPVILAGDFSGYINQIGLTDSDRPLRQSEDEYYAWLGERLNDGFRYLRASERTVVLFKQTYVTGINLPECLAKPGAASLAVALQRECAPWDTAKARHSARKADVVAEGLAEAFPNLVVVDPKALFCESTQCATHDAEGRIYFRDTAHLTNEGSAFLIGKASAILRKALDLGEH